MRAIIPCFAILMLMVDCDQSSVSSGPPTPHIYDLSDRTLNHIGWPADNHDSIWLIPRPGPVRILLPDGLELSGTPVAVQFGRDAKGNGGVLYFNDGERFNEAFEQGKTYCKTFGVPLDRFLRWREQGGGSTVNPNCEAWLVNERVEIRIGITDSLAPPKKYVTTIAYSWRVGVSHGSSEKATGSAQP